MDINFVNGLLIRKTYYNLLRLFVFVILFVALLIESIKSRIFINTRTVPISNVFARVRDTSLYFSWICVNIIVIETSNCQLIYYFLTTQHYFSCYYFIIHYMMTCVTLLLVPIIVYWPILSRKSILLKITCSNVYGVIIFDLTVQRP